MTRSTVNAVKFVGIPAAIVIVLYVIYHFLAAALALAGHDSPIEVAGGSIHVCSRNSTINTEGTGWSVTLPSGDHTRITPAHVSGVHVPASLASGWTITISNLVTAANGTQSDIPATVTLTNTGDDTVHIASQYLKPSSDGKALIFHDSSHCPTTAAEDPKCDHLHYVTITAKDADTASQGTCETSANDGKCKIYLGTIGGADYACENAKP